MRLSLALLLLPSTLLAWGERGHHAIGRVAALSVLSGVRLEGMAEEEARRHEAFAEFFKMKAVQLGHLANIPDTAWRNADAETRALNWGTHFLDLEDLTTSFSLIPLDYPEALRRFHGKPSPFSGKTVELSESGTLIWRAQQLWEKMAEGFALASLPGQEKAGAMQALLYGGLLGHFIGDATMPYHTTSDYDGQKAGNGGIHSYLDELPTEAALDLEERVSRRLAKQARLFKLAEKLAESGDHPASFLARALCARSHDRIAEVKRIDDKARLPSGQRAPPEEAVEEFQPFIEEQTALSAAVLARLWRAAWEKGGKPDLSKARFWDYAHKPDFVLPSYDPEAIERLRKRAREKEKEKR